MTIPSNPDDFLDQPILAQSKQKLVQTDDFLNAPISSVKGVKETPIYLEEGVIDPRLKLLSNSSRSTLNKCPRKYQLYRLGSEEVDLPELEGSYQQLTFDYGTVVGLGIQRILAGETLDEFLIDCFLEWNVDIELRNLKQRKSFWEAVLAMQKFEAVVAQGYLKDYELIEYNGKPAAELSFRLSLPDGFYYRGYIDGVLRHKITGAIVVLEDKTSSFRVIPPAAYKHSGQALGYSIVLDHIFPDLSSYTVLYLVYSSTAYEYTELPFEKSALSRASWLTSLIMDTKKLQMYEAYGMYPMNGDFCYDFFRDCEYLGLCELSTERITKQLTEEMIVRMDEKEVYDFDVSFDELVAAQETKLIET